VLTNAVYPVLKLVNGQITSVDEPALTALNMRLRDDYSKDCAGGVERWNKIIEKEGVKFRLELPHVAFHRKIGEFRDVHVSPRGVILSDADWAKVRDDYLPSLSDGDFISSLMKPTFEAGKYASWIAPPKMGIDSKPGDFEYVQIAA
jgi:benzoyl-CoA 2,3-dioxygenase component B